MVVYLHSYYLEGEQYPVSQYIQYFLGGGICGVANYMFFLISGYLYFQNINCYTSFKQKIKKRIKSLLIPYLLWNVIFLLWYIILALIPALQEKFVNDSIISKLVQVTWYEGLYMIFIKPAAFQLWFLRDLMVFVLISPIIYWLMNRLKVLFLVILLLASMLESTCGFLAMFVLGGYLSFKNIDIEQLTFKLRDLLPLFILVYIVGAIVYPLHVDWLKHLYVFIYAFGIISLWCLYDIFGLGKAVWYEPFLGYGFFIYCFHIPFFNILKKLNLMVLGESQMSLIALYFINPIIAVVLIVFIAKLLQRIIPKFYLVLTGYRK